MKSDIDIAQGAELLPIRDIAGQLGLGEDDIEAYGRYKAKVKLEALEARGEGRKGKLILVTGINPTPAGEGKSTVCVGLADALTLRGHRTVLCLRQPSLGPVFGVKGGAAGGGYSQVVPMEDINLHFTGDFHAITTAHALLSALLDNHLHQGNALNIDPRRITWKRAVDMNDRALRRAVIGLGGATEGVPREEGFMITAASEVMAIFALSKSRADLEERLSRIIVGYNRNKEPVRAGDLKAAGAMTLLLKDALAPNLVQTLGHTPAFVHAGPFGNIAHGCNSLIATRAGLALGDVVVTEAGFGSDLGAEKFFDIKCRAGGLEPAAAAIVATIRAMKLHGGVPLKELGKDDPDAVRRGFENVAHHVANIRQFGVPPVVALNRFSSDSDEEIEALRRGCTELGVPFAITEGHARGGAGAVDLADAVMALAESGAAEFRPLYDLDLPLAEKIEIVAKRVYGAEGVNFAGNSARQLAQFEAIGLRDVAVCMAKTQYSLSDDATRLNRPTGFRITVRDVTPSAGAGFVVVRTGEIMTMPGLPKVPAAEAMSVDRDGKIAGLF